MNYPSISRQHAALCRGEDESGWTLYDLGSKGGTAVNGRPVTDRTSVKLGDTVTLGGVPLVFLPQTVGAQEELEKKRQAERPAAMGLSFLWLTVFQILTALQLTLASGGENGLLIPGCFLMLTAVMWLYAAALRLCRCVGFELETIAFYLSTLSLAVTASSAPASLPKQLLAVVLGVCLFLTLGVLLRDLERVKKLRWLMAAGAMGLLGITLVLGKAKFGATNWITLGGLSFQPSEIAKICYIFAGSATSERLFRRRNLTLFIVLTGVCIGLLGLMSDFGTAAIFFVDVSGASPTSAPGTLPRCALICGAAASAPGSSLEFKPYILSRFCGVGARVGSRLRAGISRPAPCRRRPPAACWAWGPETAGWNGSPPGDTDLVSRDRCVKEWGLVIALLAAAVHPDAGVVCRPGVPGGALRLLYHCRLCRRLPAGVPDLPERLRLRGHPAPYRR